MADEPARPSLAVTMPPRSGLHPLSGSAPAGPQDVASIPGAHHYAVLFPASTSAFQGAGIGLFVSAIKNSLESHNKGAMGIFTRTGWIGGYLAAIGFTYTATRNTLLNTLSPASTATPTIAASAAGCAAGFVAGVRTGSIPKAMGLCAFMGGALGTFDAAGARIGNTDTGVTGAATVATQEQIRKQFFKKRVTEPSE